MNLNLPKTYTHTFFICAEPPRFGEEQAKVSLYTYDPRESQYTDPEIVVLGTCELTVDVPQVSEQDAVNQTIANLKRQRDAVLGEAHAKAQVFNRRINELLALEHKSGV